LVERHLDGELSPEHARFVTDHLAQCAACGGRFRFQSELRQSVTAALVEDPPPGLTERVVATLRAEEP
jgi:anti-sigma factor RsiW